MFGWRKQKSYIIGTRSSGRSENDIRYRNGCCEATYISISSAAGADIDKKFQNALHERAVSKRGASRQVNVWSLLAHTVGKRRPRYLPHRACCHLGCCRLGFHVKSQQFVLLVLLFSFFFPAVLYKYYYICYILAFSAHCTHRLYRVDSIKLPFLLPIFRNPAIEFLLHWNEHMHIWHGRFYLIFSIFSFSSSTWEITFKKFLY